MQSLRELYKIGRTAVEKRIDYIEDNIQDNDLRKRNSFEDSGR